MSELELGLQGKDFGAGGGGGALQVREMCRSGPDLILQAVVLMVHLVRRLNSKTSNGQWFRARF